MQEIWKDIEEYNGLYQVSNLGNIKKTKSGLILSPHITWGGYKYVNIIVRGKRRNLSVSRLVAKAFVSNPENKPLVIHLNRVKNDSRAINLKWATVKENSNYKK